MTLSRIHRVLVLCLVLGSLVACTGGGEATEGGVIDQIDTSESADASDPATTSDPTEPDASDVSDASDPSATPDPTEPDASDVSDASDASDPATTPDPTEPDASDVSDASDASDVSATPDPTEPPCESTLIHGEGEPLAALDACQRLTYGLYAAEGESAVVHRLPDFSFAGYGGGGVAIPDIPEVIRLSPISGDSHAQIQDAIDTVSALPLGADGYRGAVVLDDGEYEVGDTLIISASGVVLRGGGQRASDTVLVATMTSQHNLIEVRGTGNGLREEEGTRRTITASRVAVGATRIPLEDPSIFQVGDLVAVVRTPNDAWINMLDMAQWGWTADAYAMTYQRRVVDVKSSAIVVDTPLVDAIQSQYGGGYVYRASVRGRISHVGIEKIRLRSSFTSSTDEDHGWSAVYFSRAENSWVREMTAVHFGYSAVHFDNDSVFNTAEEVAHLDPVSRITGGRRYSFYVADGSFNLFQRCYSNESRHDFITGSRTTGPNVWLDCYAHQSNSDAGPHHRWSTGVLMDNVYSKELHVENRGDSGSGHGWAGAQVLFWNSLGEDIVVDVPEGAMNWSIGNVGRQGVSNHTPDAEAGWWESFQRPVEPRSLYLKQLSDRLGYDAVVAVTTPSQRAGRIWGKLKRWAGNGNLESKTPPGDVTCEEGIASANRDVCCASSCGSCGGSGCSSRPGGASACCTGRVKESARSCEVYGAPCVLTPEFQPAIP